MRSDTGEPDNSRMDPDRLARSTAEKVRLRENLVLFRVGSTRFFSVTAACYALRTRLCPRVSVASDVAGTAAKDASRGPACDRMARWLTGDGITSLTWSTPVVERLI